MLRSILLLLAASAAHAQLTAQVDRLMGTPREIVGQLTNLPWRAQLPDTLTGFRAMAPGESIRLVSIERPARALALVPLGE